MRPPGGWIQKDCYAPQPERRDEGHVEFRRYGVQQQNAVPRIEAGTSHLIGSIGGRGIEFSKGVASIAIPMNVDNRRVSRQFLCALQQNLGDIHFARSLEYSVYLRITVA